MYSFDWAKSTDDVLSCSSHEANEPFEGPGSAFTMCADWVRAAVQVSPSIRNPVKHSGTLYPPGSDDGVDLGVPKTGDFGKGGGSGKSETHTKQLTFLVQFPNPR